MRVCVVCVCVRACATPGTKSSDLQEVEHKASREVRNMDCKLLQALERMEQLSGEMEQYKLAVLAVTETHLPAEGKMVLDVSMGYRLIFTGRTDGNKAGVGLAFFPCAWNALHCYEACIPRILTPRVGPLAIIVVYAPTNQASEEVKEQFNADLDRVI